MGGMAEIYLSRSMATTGISKFFAIKRILPQFSEQIEFIDMFKDEAKIAVNLSHANIVSIYEFGVEKNQFYLVMDYVEGRNLRQILNKMKKSGVSFSIEQVIFIIKEVAAGLDAAHRCIDAQTGKPLNIIHRDMSPQNVMVSFEGEVKVVDFGIAKAETQIETTRAGTLKGKFGYMSPEQAEGQAVDLRTDIFALGIVFWELLANDRLFVANNEVNTLRKIRDCIVPSLRKINPNIPQELERIVGKALAKDRNLRYQTGAAFQRDLSKFLNRQFPDFSPHDFSVFVKTLFAGEILESRKKMIEYARVDTRIAATPAQPQLQAPVHHPVAQQEDQKYDRTVITQTNSITEGTDGGGSSPGDLAAPDPRDKQRPRPSFANPIPNVSANNQPRQLNVPSPSPASSNSPAGQSRRAYEPSLSVDRTGYHEREQRTNVTGTFSNSGVYGGSRVGYTRSQVKKSSFPSPVMIVLGLAIVCASAYYVMGPDKLMGLTKKTMTSITDLASKYGSNNASSEVGARPQSQAAANNEIAHYDIPVTSQPAGAEILINDKTQPDVTPTTVQLDEGRDVKVTLRMSGYSDYSETFKVTGARHVHAALRAERRGWLDINVVGAGQIYVDGKLVSPGSPANHVIVTADREVLVSTFDPATNTGDEIRVLVSEGKGRKITLIPRANYRPRGR